MRSLRLAPATLGLVLFAGCARGTTLFDDAGAVFPAAPDSGATVPREDAGAVTGERDGLDDMAPGGDGGDGAQAPDPEADAGSPAPRADAGGSTPDPEPECKPGTYAGTFSGTIAVLGFINIPISGTITIDALAAAGNDLLTIDHGKVTGSDQDGNPVTAEVVGTLRCATKMLEGGALQNGVYVRQSINQTVNFSGTVDATYHSGNPPTVSGSWHTQGGLESGSGPFDAVLQQNTP